MFRKSALQNQIVYAESKKMCRDFLIQEFRASDPGAQPTGSSWTNVLSHLSDRTSIELVQNTVCLRCAMFIIDLLGRSIQQGNSTNVQATAKIIFAKPRRRRMDVIIKTAAKGCWVCTQIIRNARRDEKDKIAAVQVLLQAFNFSPDEFSVSAFGRKRWHFYTADFRISPVETPASPHRAFRLEGEETKSIWLPDGLSKARTWIRTCEEEHESCRQLDGDVSKSYPSRLLDLANAGQGSVTLVTGTSIPEGAKYASLSHCWGNVKQSVLLKSNIAACSTRILVDTLPKTFSDAIRICMDLEICYIWIDSLCIIQDDKDDWEAEAPRMAEIYSNAYVNLAASASRSDSGGLLRPFDRCLVSPLIFRIVDETGADQNFKVERDENFGTYVNDAPLNTRAWVFQERALSRRILHFANDQIYWQCPSKVDAQFDIRTDIMDKIIGNPWQAMQQWNTTPATNRELEGDILDDERLGLAHGQPYEHPLLSKWDDIVQAYSKCDLTFTSDKLIAVAGLAKQIQRLTNWPDTDYFAGLWRHGFERRLLWGRLGPSKYPPNLAVPSWSWAHINSEIIWPPMIWTDKRNSTGRILVELLSASTTPENTALGSVKGGAIQLRGLLCQMNLRRSPWEDWHPAGKVRLRNKWFDLKVLEADFDLATSMWGVLGRKIFFLPILDKLCISPDDAKFPGRRTRSLYGLMLEPTSRKDGQYRRVGTLIIEEDAYDLVQLGLSSSSLDKKYIIEADTNNNYVFEII